MGSSAEFIRYSSDILACDCKLQRAYCLSGTPLPKFKPDSSLIEPSEQHQSPVFSCPQSGCAGLYAGSLIFRRSVVLRSLAARAKDHGPSENQASMQAVMQRKDRGLMRVKKPSTGLELKFTIGLSTCRCQLSSPVYLPWRKAATK